MNFNQSQNPDKIEQQRASRRLFRMMRLIVSISVIGGFFAVRFMVDFLHVSFGISVACVAVGVALSIILTARLFRLGRFAKK